VALLGRKLHARKWRALLSLTLGVVLISSETSPARAMRSAASAASQLEAWRHYGIGMGAAAGDVILSGFASIYFERVLKSVDETYSVRSGRDRWTRGRER
jgi:UDP-sugar transporter A1/2/3